jgi:asparagine synthase (glutamine-hydrolysing)
MDAFSPPEITSAEKQGFSAPDASWFRNEVKNYVERQLVTDGALIHSLVSTDAIRSIIREHMTGGRNHRLMIWSLLNVEQWLQNEIGGK